MLELNKKFKPSKEMIRSAEEYVNDYVRWRTFGFKTVGGYDEQEAEYTDALEICKIAYETVEREVEEQQRRRQESENRKKPRKRL